MKKIPEAFEKEIRNAIAEGRLFTIPDIELLDVTLRDGGFSVSFDWEKDFIKTFVAHCEMVNIKNVEVGYIGGVKSSDGWYNGFGADVSAEFISELKNECPDISVVSIINPWRLKRQVDLKDYKESGLDLLRIAYNPAFSNECWSIIDQSIKGEIKTGLNVTSVGKYTSDKLFSLIKEATNRGVQNISFADTTSSLTPMNVRSFVDALNYAKNNNITLGFHGHDVLGFGNANALNFIELGTTTIDVSVCGIGRGGKNLLAETWLLMMLSQNRNDERAIKSIPDISNLVANKLSLNTVDLVGLICAVLSISPELVESVKAENNTDQFHLNRLCMDIISKELINSFV